MKKRIVSLMLTLMLLIGMMPSEALALEGQESISGTAYISISLDDKFVISNGEDSGTVMAYVPVDLAEVSEINLEDYWLEEYAYDPDYTGVNKVTVLHLYLYVLDKYYEGTAAELEVQGGLGSMYMKNGFWGHDENLTYYVNGEYPLQSEAWGATADIMEIRDGDFVDVSMYGDWSFWQDPAAGYHYFVDEDNNITHDYEAVAGKNKEIGYTYAKTDWNITYATEYVPKADSIVYYSKTLYDEDAPSVVTDEDGKATINFPESGTYHLWTDGEPGQEYSSIVSAPAYAKVMVAEPDTTLKEFHIGDDVIDVNDEQDVYNKEVDRTDLDEENSILVNPVATSETATVEMLNGDEYEAVPEEGVKVQFTDEPTKQLKFRVTDSGVIKEYALNLSLINIDVTLEKFIVGDDAIEVNAEQDDYDKEVYRTALNEDNSILVNPVTSSEAAKVEMLNGDEYEAVPEEGVTVQFTDESTKQLKFKVTDISESKEYTLTLSLKLEEEDPDVEEPEEVRKVYKHVSVQTIYPFKEIRVNTPKGVKRSDIEWSSWNNKILTVDKQGRMKGLKAGTTRIRAKVTKRGIETNYYYFVRIRPARPTYYKAKISGKYAKLETTLPYNRHGVRVYRAVKDSKGKYNFKEHMVKNSRNRKWSGSVYQKKNTRCGYYLRAYRVMPLYKRNAKGYFEQSGSRSFTGYRTKVKYLAR